VAVGDFNGDGHLDVVVTGSDNNGNGRVSILLGNGDGTFQAAQNFPVGIYPGSVAVGDFNGDGRLDVVVTGSDNNGNGRVSILLGNGDGTFQAAQNFPAAGTYPGSVVAGDFNGDGRLDLAVAANQGSSLQGTVSILLGNGDGTFQAAQNFPVGSYPSSVVVGDVNGDGVPDLVVTSDTLLTEVVAASGTVRVLLGKGDGTFRAFPASHVSYVAGDFVSSVAVGDFNGDGWLDAVTANGSGDVSILLNDGVWGGGR
jgi:hypothetical protein